MKSKWASARRILIAVGLTVNAIFYFTRAPDVAAKPGKGLHGQTDAVAVAAATPPAGVPPSRRTHRLRTSAVNKNAVPVPIAFYQRLNSGSAGNIVERDSGELTEAGRQMLGLSGDGAEMVSAATRAAIVRHAEIQKRYARVTEDEKGGWMVEVGANASAAKDESLAQMSRELQAILPASKAEFVANMAASAGALKPLQVAQVFSVGREGDGIRISSGTFPYMFNSYRSMASAQKSLSTGWLYQLTCGRSP